MSENGRAAVIVAGGYSRRFGDEEKALAVIDDDPLLRRVVERSGAHADELVVNCRRDQRPDFTAVLDEVGLDIESRFACDPVPGGGPVAGMMAGFRVTDARHVLVVSCDLPFLTDDVVETLFEMTETADRTTVPTVKGHPQPLCAVYRRRPALAACRTALSNDDGRACGVVERLDPVWVDTAHHRPFRDVDTQDDLTWARKSAE